MPGLSLAFIIALAQTPPPPPPIPRPAATVGGQLSQGGQVRDQNQRLPLVGAGSIGGTVVAENGRPVKGARVSLGGGAVGRTEMSNATGEFFFDKLPEGRYSINVSRPRYLSSSYGQKKPERSGTAIQLADGEHKKDLRVTLFAAAVITGVIYGDDGEPVQNAQVRAMRYSMRTGVRRLQQVNNAGTDDRGVYRLYGLTPGEYVISAVSNNSEFVSTMSLEMAVAMERAQAAGAGDAVRFSNGSYTLANGQTIEQPAPIAYAPTFYPGSTSPASATSVTISGGEERQGIDITLMKVQTATVTGMVVSATGVAPQNVSVSLQPVDEGAQGVNVSSSRTTQDGRFTLRNVPPGQYNVVARATNTVRVELPASVSAAGVGGRVQEVATQQTVSTGRTFISVDGSTLSNVVVTLDGGRSVSGRVVFEGGMPDMTRMRITASLQVVQTGSGFNLPTPPPATVAADGTFKINNVSPGRYTLRVSGVQNFGLKSSMVRGRDSLDYPFDIDSEDVSDALVTMASGMQPTELTGMIMDQSNAPAVDYTIVVFSSDQRFWTPGSRRISTARPGTDGKYTLRGLPPGSYQIAALDDLEPGMQYDLEFLKALFAASTRVTLAEGAKITQDLRITIQK